MFTNLYSKVLLTIIAFSLALLALNPWIVPTRAEASMDAIDFSMIQSALSSINSKLADIEWAIRNTVCSR